MNTCEQCGARFKRKHPNNAGRFCSRKCMYDSSLPKIGEEFYRWTVLQILDLGRDGKRDSWLRVRCECGQIRVRKPWHVIHGLPQSCGCLRDETSVQNGRRKFPVRHGLTGTPEYKIWAAAKGRCTNPKDKSWKNYGGRGITFEFESFDHFITSLGRRPSPRHSLERLNNEAGYSPTNCAWVLVQVQAVNKRNTIRVKARGEECKVDDLVRMSGLRPKTVRARYRAGWCGDCIVSIPKISGYPGRKRCPHRTPP